MAISYLSEEEIKNFNNAEIQIRNIDHFMDDIDKKVAANNVSINEEELHYFLDNSFSKEQIYAQVEEQKAKKQNEVLITIEELNELKKYVYAYKEILNKLREDYITKRNEMELQDIQSKNIDKNDTFMQDYYKQREQELISEIEQAKHR